MYAPPPSNPYNVRHVGQGRHTPATSAPTPAHYRPSGGRGGGGGGAHRQTPTPSSSSSEERNRATALLLVLGLALCVILQLTAMRQPGLSDREEHPHAGLAEMSRRYRDRQERREQQRKRGGRRNGDGGGGGKVEGRGDGQQQQQQQQQQRGMGLRVKVPDGRGREVDDPHPPLALKIGKMEGVTWDGDRRKRRERGQLGGGWRGDGGGGGGDAMADGADEDTPPRDNGFEGRGREEGGAGPSEVAGGEAHPRRIEGDGAERKEGNNHNAQPKAGADEAAAAPKRDVGGGRGRSKEAPDGTDTAAKAKRKERSIPSKIPEIDAGVRRESSLGELVHRHMPAGLDYAADITTKPNRSGRRRAEVPIFFSIPHAGTDLVTDVLSQCLKLGTVTDLQPAKDGWGLRAEDGVVITEDFYDAIDVLDGEHRGRLFAFFRHPVERAIAALGAQKDADPRGVGALGSIEDYAKSDYVDDNWVVRHLSGVLEGDVTLTELAIAKEILRTKFVIGLLPYRDGSVKRFERYFGWKFRGEEAADCRMKVIEGAAAAEEGTAVDAVKKGSTAWYLLEKRNDLDLRLFEYANHLFHQQGKILFQ